MNMIIKFKCKSITYNENDATVILKPVSSESKNNEILFEGEPVGEIKLKNFKTAPSCYFTPGRAYYINIEAAPK